ncbi:MAG: hypothetical protein KDD22_00685 [Bdellovibrionales bacterium]|nr:hypothetical protein [Bdellovibrionales bacterium]
MQGRNLIKEICSSTDLPEELLEKELLALIDSSNLNSETVTLENLRDLLSLYLQDVLLEAKSTLP